MIFGKWHGDEEIHVIKRIRKYGIYDHHITVVTYDARGEVKYLWIKPFQRNSDRTDAAGQANIFDDCMM